MKSLHVLLNVILFLLILISIPSIAIAQSTTPSPVLLAQASGQQGQVLGLFDDIVNFFKGVLGLSDSVEAKCQTTADNLSEKVIPDDRYMVPGVVTNNCNRQPIKQTTITATLTGNTQVAKPPYGASSIILPFVEVTAPHGINGTNSRMPNHDTTSKSGSDSKANQKSTTLFYQGGAATGLKFMKEFAQARAVGYDRGIFGASSANERTRPYECRSSIGEWKPCKIVVREEVLRAVFRGYACSFADQFGWDKDYYCNNAKTADDYTIGYLFAPCLSNGSCSLSSNEYLETWFTYEEPTDMKFREFKAAEIGCKNTSFYAADLDRGRIEEICRKIMGPDFAQGKLAPFPTFFNQNNSSLYTEKMGLYLDRRFLLLTCADDCIYNPDNFPAFIGAFYNIPPRTQYIGGKATEMVLSASPDPVQNPKSDDLPVSLPGIQSNTDLVADFMQPLFSSYETTQFCKDYRHEIPDQINGDLLALGGPVVNAIGSLAYDASYVMREPDIRVEASTTQPDPSASPIIEYQQVSATRQINITIDIPPEIEEMARYLTDRKCGVSNNFLNHEGVQKMQEQVVGGGSLADAPTKSNFNCTGQSSCPNGLLVPEAGGAALASYPGLRGPNGLQGSGIVPVSQIPFDSLDPVANVGRSIRDIAEKYGISNIASKPWEELASFQSNKSNKEVSLNR